MKSRYLFLCLSLFLAALACNLPAQIGEPAAITPEVPTVPPTPRLSEFITINSEPFSEEGKVPIYFITAQIPYAEGADPTRLANFNSLLKDTVQKEIASFRKGVQVNAPIQPVSAGSSFDLTYTVIGQALDYWSIKYDISFYFDGAAHPGHYNMNINYDLDRDRPLTLDELFLPGSNYLQVIADYCKAELTKRDIAFEGFSTGADPLPENYTHWNMSNEGLVITFDEYQVAPYAAGPQVVVIPFSALQSVSDPNSILSFFVK